MATRERFDPDPDDPFTHQKGSGPAGFDVTARIGRVEFSELGTMTPIEAAYTIIARHDAEGEYQFPAPNGGTIVVTVEYRS